MNLNKSFKTKIYFINKILLFKQKSQESEWIHIIYIIQEIAKLNETKKEIKLGKYILIREEWGNITHF